MKPNLKRKSVEKSVVLSVDRSGIPVNVAANLIPKSCNINDYIEAIETLKAFGLSDRYGDFMINEAESQLWGKEDA